MRREDIWKTLRTRPGTEVLCKEPAVVPLTSPPSLALPWSLHTACCSLLLQPPATPWPCLHLCPPGPEESLGEGRWELAGVGLGA